MTDTSAAPGPNKPGTQPGSRARLSALAWVIGPLQRAKLWAQVLIGMALGILLGLVLGPDLGLISTDQQAVLADWLALPGQLFLGLIGMVLIPLVMASIILGLVKAQGRALRSVGLRLGIFVVATTCLAASLGAGLALWLEPGTAIYEAQADDTVPLPPRKPLPEPPGARAPGLIADLIPTNPVESFAERDLLAVVILALFIGLAARTVAQSRISPFIGLVEGLMEISLAIVRWAMMLAPLAVFGLMARLVATQGLGTLLAMSAYVGTVLLGLALLFLSYLLIVQFLAGKPVKAFLQGIGPVLLLAFSTSSSAAVMPVSVKTAKVKLDVAEALADLVIPLGATINMAGTALYQAVAILFLAQVAGVDLTVQGLMVMIGTLVLSSIGAPGTPGVSIAILVSVATGFGIPEAGLALVIGVDRILDMARTTVNVTGDLTACVLLSGRSKLLTLDAPA